ncbi:peptidase U32 family protein [Desulforegula conservatrix]|uniref:peptidase U32 family protein n=1 Tax=Desulforegula conservatrix TaxID=153026 RepID=UPI0003F8926E|nr:U32 family peptidase [Desulforegula conservatrix]
MKKIELLSPAKNTECGIAAINHGADAVYIGASRFGARKSAGNSMSDIEKLVTYGNRFNVDIYLTLNTILMDSELKEAEEMVREAWNAGVSAIIVQDMAYMEMNLPPIRLFASTQTDNRLHEKILSLEKSGFDRVILARELSIDEIRKIRSETTVDLEAFVHGAACYSYSGRCYMSQHIGGRSANRGECGQPCRLKWDLRNGAGGFLLKDRHLLSLKDMDRSDYLKDMIDAGITSFKIEGRLKDEDYVKNITAFYRRKLDSIFEGNKDIGASSSGRTFFFFEPDPYRTFNRGLNSFFNKNGEESVFSINTPKSLGKEIGKVSKVSRDFIEIDTKEKISNNDGLCFVNDEGILTGFQVDKNDNGRIYPSFNIFKTVQNGMTVFRNRDHGFLKILASQKTCERRIGLNIKFYETQDGFALSATDENGIYSSVHIECEKIPAEKPESAIRNIENQLSKFGDSIFYKMGLKIESRPYFIQLKIMNEMRRALVAEMGKARCSAVCLVQPKRSIIADSFVFFDEKGVQKLDYSANVSNQKARDFYIRHGIKEIEPAYEISVDQPDSFLMYSRHCILKNTGLCLKKANNADGFYIEHKNYKFRIIHDCKKCEMYIRRI